MTKRRRQHASLVSRSQNQRRAVHLLTSLLVFPALALLLVPALAAAQDPGGVRLGLRYQAEYQPGLVVLPFSAAASAAETESIRGIIRQDLDYSDRFSLREATGVRSGEEINVPLWKERGADYVVEGTLRPRAGGVALELRLHDAVYGRVKGEGSFNLPMPGDPNFRMAVHAAADELVRWATGDPGMAASRVAFVLEGRGSKEIYIADYDGENVQRFTSDGTTTLSPAWSPDGRRLAYTSFRNGTPALLERELGSSRARLLSDRQGINITPAYAPDGQRIAFATTYGGATELAIYNRERGCCLEALTEGRRFDSLSPAWAPDGQRFAFVSNRLGGPQVYVMSPGGSPRLISDYVYGQSSYNTAPDWSPRGDWVAYASRINGQHQLKMVPAAGGAARLLTNEGSNEDPSWAPDGRHVVFASTREGGGLFVLDTVSGRVRPLLRGRGYGLPAWSPPLMKASVVTMSGGN